MNKLELLGIGTQPKYDDNDQWTGAEIFANCWLTSGSALQAI